MFIEVKCHRYYGTLKPKDSHVFYTKKLFQLIVLRNDLTNEYDKSRGSEQHKISTLALC